MATQLSLTLSVVTLCCTYPNDSQPQLGVFVRARLLELAKLAHVRVLAPFPVIEYGNPARRLALQLRRIKPHTEGQLSVEHPRWIYLPGGGVLNAFLLFAQTARVVRELQRNQHFDILDSHFGFPDGIAAALLAALFQCPFAITLRGNETMHSERYLRRLALRWALRRASCVIAVSEPLRHFAIECGVRPSQTVTIPNGVDTTVYRPRVVNGIRARIGLPEDAPLIASVGYLIERKGHHRVLRALGAMRKRGSRAHLVIVGGPGAEGEFETRLHGLVSELDLDECVHFTGSQPQGVVAELLASATVLCLASSREGCPNVVNEALACGTPVVASAVGSVRQMVPTREYGFVVPPNDDAALEAALDEALARSWNREQIAAWGALRSWQHVAREVLATLQRAARSTKELSH